MARDVPARSPARRLAQWLGVAVAAALAIALANRGDAGADPDVALPVMHAHPASARRAGADNPRHLAQLAARLRELAASAAARPDFPALADDGRQAWASLAPPVLASAPGPVAPAGPEEPPLPFQWVGRWEQPATADAAAPAPMAILSGATNTWVVRTGDLVAVDWKVESITADQVRVTYLPTSSSHSLSLASP